MNVRAAVIASALAIASGTVGAGRAEAQDCLAPCAPVCPSSTPTDKLCPGASLLLTHDPAMPVHTVVVSYCGGTFQGTGLETVQAKLNAPEELAFDVVTLPSGPTCKRVFSFDPADHLSWNA